MRLDTKDSVHETKKRRLPKQEIKKYRTRADEGTRDFNQQQTERVPSTRNDQVIRWEQQARMPATDNKIPKAMKMSAKSQSYETQDKPP